MNEERHKWRGEERVKEMKRRKKKRKKEVRGVGRERKRKAGRGGVSVTAQLTAGM